MYSLKCKQYHLGQSMVEYTIVLVFGVMVITTGPGGDMSAKLLQVMKDNYEGYSFGLSLSEAPDYDDAITYAAELSAAGYQQADIDRLTASSADVYKDLSPYNKDPLSQLKSGVTSLKNCINAVPTILTGGSGNCP